MKKPDTIVLILSGIIICVCATSQARASDPGDQKLSAELSELSQKINRCYAEKRLLDADPLYMRWLNLLQEHHKREALIQTMSVYASYLNKLNRPADAARMLEEVKRMKADPNYPESESESIVVVTAKPLGKDVDFGPYLAAIQRSIKRAWYPPKGQEEKTAKVIFRVHNDGKMSDLKLDSPSGVESADQAALKAVEKAAPFGPLPPGSPDYVDIKYKFEYHNMPQPVTSGK